LIGYVASNILLFRHNAETFPALAQRIESLQIDRIILSILLSSID